MAADTQHQLARKILSIIRSAKANGEQLNYTRVAAKMDRAPKHARAMARACDLLDAAACLSGTPLLALVAVHTQSGEVNPNAFKKELSESQRLAVIAHSQQHVFNTSDYEAIEKGLNGLTGKGADSAWDYIEEVLYPGNLLYLRLVGDSTDHNSNAIDDLGTDAPDRARSVVWAYLRDPRVRDSVLKRANGRCEFCNQLGFSKPDGSRYLESHHVIALANDGEDRLSNVIALCPNDHREAHFGEKGNELERKMILRLKEINR